MSIKKYFSMGLAGILLFCGNAHAQSDTDSSNHERIYQVEIIVFGRVESNPQEHWPTDVKLAYPENVVSLKTENTPEGFSLLPAGERSLNNQAATLARSGSYTLLYHQAWRQMIDGRKTNVLITGGKKIGNHQELEGSIALSVGQFLKIQTNLWLTHFAPAGTTSTGSWPELPPLPNTVSDDTTAPNLMINRIVKLSQERNMRSNEIHYIDHPLLGIIVKISPYEASANKPN